MDPGLSESARRSLPTHERFLFGLCYRMTGSASDAEDIVQETFIRALERPPEREDELRPWLVRVAINLAKDSYRRRKRRSYDGPWLPAVVESAGLTEPASTDGRYDLLESASFAFLVALEALRPRERAVLLLRDVLDYSVIETAESLAMSEANVKTTLHRARKAMEAYDATRCDWSAEARAKLEERNRDALFRFVTCLAAQDTAGVEALMAEGVRALSDGGSEFLAAKVPVVGRDKVAFMFMKLTRQRQGEAPSVKLVSLNGLPALLFEYPQQQARVASRVVLRCELGADGLITEVHSVLATEKLSSLRGA